MSRAVAWCPLVIAAFVCACSSCTEGGAASPDGGTDTGTDDTDTGTGPYTTDAGPWDWENLPPGEDCGPGCTQIALTEDLYPREWDVMNEFVGFQNQDYKIEIVNYLLKRRLELPNIYPDIQFVGHFPAISESGIYYSYLSKGSIALVIADLQEKIQTVIWEGELDSSIPAWAPRLDAYDERLVSEGGEDCSSGKCFRQPPWPAKGVDVYECAFGLSIWGDRLVCMTLNNPPDDILAYDLTTMWTFPITDDNYYQIWPRIHEDRVVWQDFRLGSGVPTGSWEHSAIFAKDLSTGDVKQITDGSAIASFPDVHGDRIVWTDYRHCGNPHDKNDFANVEVYGYNLATQTEFRVTNLPGRPKSIPRVWGEKAFVEMRTMGGGTAVYMFDLPPEAY